MTTHIEEMTMEKIKTILIEKKEPLFHYDKSFNVGDILAFFPFESTINKDGMVSPCMVKITNINNKLINPKEINLSEHNMDMMDFELTTVTYDTFVSFTDKEKSHLKSLFLYLDDYSKNEKHNPNDVISIISNVLKVGKLSIFDLNFYFNYFGILPKHFKLEF